MTDQPIMEFTSHVAGANAKVAIYPDRIEWSRRGLKPAGGVTGALLTGGLSLALPGRKDTNMIPVRQSRNKRGGCSPQEPGVRPSERSELPARLSEPFVLRVRCQR